ADGIRDDLVTAVQTCALPIFEGAEARCRERLLRNPDDRQTLHAMGSVCRKLGQLDEAADVFAQLARLDPDDKNAAYLNEVLSGKIGRAACRERVKVSMVR